MLLRMIHGWPVLLLFLFTIPLKADNRTAPLYQSPYCLDSSGQLIASASSKVFRPISLKEALISTIHRQLEIQIAELNIAFQRGVIQQAAGPFDAVLNDEYVHIRIEDEQYLPRGIKSNIDATRDENFVTVVKRTRLGTIFTLRSDQALIRDKLAYEVGVLPDPKVSLGDIILRIEQSLLRGGLGSGIDFQREKAAKRELDAVKYDVLQTMSEKVRDTTVEYWDFVAAIKALRIHQQTEKKFEDLIKKVQRLVEAEEVAAGDLIPVQASLAIKRRNVIAAVQNVYLAMKQLLFAMGAMDNNLCCDDCNFDQFIDVFPRYPDLNFDGNCLLQFNNALVNYALKERFDVKASLIREEVALTLLEGLNNNTLPQVNVFGEMKRSDFKTGKDSKTMFSALYFKHPELDLRVGVSVSFPFRNDDALGAYKQGTALHNQTILRTMFIKQQVTRDLLVSLRDHFDLANQIVEVNKSANYYRQVVANELEKLGAGFTSIFNLISYENALSEVLLLQNALYSRFSQNLANMHFFSGTLLKAEGGAVEIEDVTQPPFLFLCRHHQKERCR